MADGIADRFVGDAVLGLFIPGMTGPDHTAAAVDAARAIVAGTGTPRSHGSRLASRSIAVSPSLAASATRASYMTSPPWAIGEHGCTTRLGGRLWRDPRQPRGRPSYGPGRQRARQPSGSRSGARSHPPPPGQAHRGRHGWMPPTQVQETAVARGSPFICIEKHRGPQCQARRPRLRSRTFDPASVARRSGPTEGIGSEVVISLTNLIRRTFGWSPPTRSPRRHGGGSAQTPQSSRRRRSTRSGSRQGG
jgi:hypothetical protein